MPHQRFFFFSGGGGGLNKCKTTSCPPKLQDLTPYPAKFKMLTLTQNDSDGSNDIGYVAESVEQDETARTSRLILLDTLRNNRSIVANHWI